MSIKKIILLICGFLSLVVGVVGIVIPVVPTTPLILLAAACFSVSSQKMYGFLEHNRFFGPFIENFHTKQGISLKLKIGCIIYVWIGLGFSMYEIKARWAYTIFAVVGACVTIYLLFIIKTKRQEEKKNV